jgi:hypothetical protein
MIAYGRSPDLWLFGISTERIGIDRLSEDGPSREGSRVLPGIERAHAAGSDSILIVTDGELEDRESARRLAENLGVVVREIRVARAVGRPAIARVISPRGVAAGDTLEVRVEVVVGGRVNGPIRLTLSGDTGEPLDTAHVDVPSAGRTTVARLRTVLSVESDTAEWRAFDIGIDDVPQPWREAAKRRVWVHATPQPTGAVMISTDPDWEPRYLFPLLERATPGGARSYLGLGDGQYIHAGPSAGGAVSETSVRRAAETATLLVVQGDPRHLPPWLQATCRSRPAVLFLARGTGPVPGSAIEIREALGGEWYVTDPGPASPVSPYVMSSVFDGLPPLSRLYVSSGRSDWAVLQARRDRRGGQRPLAVMGGDGSRRWAVLQGEGTWRWAARGGSGLSLYRGLFAGITGWLLERTLPQPIQLEEPAPREGDRLRWRVAPDVRDLVIAVTGEDGALQWSDSLDTPGVRVDGPRVSTGPSSFSAIGRTPEKSFSVYRPLYVGASRELVPHVPGPPLDVDAPGLTGERPGAGRARPSVWPFIAAAALLCAEWLWRRRSGLR